MAKWKKAIAVIIAIIMSILLVSCSAESSETSSEEKIKEESISGFIVVAEKQIDLQYGCLWQSIMYDPDTMVMYSFVEQDDEGGFSVMYNADGSLKLYSPDTKKNTQSE